MSESEKLFKQLGETLDDQGFTLERYDFDRPWGGFFVINEEHAAAFVSKYFKDADFSNIVGDRKVSPKILVVAPEKRLSWQYHHRRSEVWEVVSGSVGIIRSDSDEETPLIELKPGDRVTLGKGERHRLVGLQEFGVVAEIWQHTDPENPSDENDIVRLQDDFGRN